MVEAKARPRGGARRAVALTLAAGALAMGGAMVAPQTAEAGQATNVQSCRYERVHDWKFWLPKEQTYRGIPDNRYCANEWYDQGTSKFGPDYRLVNWWYEVRP